MPERFDGSFAEYVREDAVWKNQMGRFIKGSFNELGGAIEELPKAINSKIAELMVRQGAKGYEYNFHDTLDKLTGSINIYTDPVTGAIKKTPVKSWKNAVDFLGDDDLFSLFGDSVGSLIAGYAAARMDEPVPTPEYQDLREFEKQISQKSEKTKKAEENENIQKNTLYISGIGYRKNKFNAS